MLPKLKFFKVNGIPGNYEANAIYLYKDAQDRLTLAMTDSTGQIVHTTHSSDSIINLISTYLGSIINQPNGIAGLDENGNLIASGSQLITALDGQNGDIRTTNQQYVWEDLIQPFIVKNTSGGNNPTFGIIFGNFQGYIFSPTTMNQVWVDFHFKHDYAEQTPVYPHVHWCPMTNQAGVVRWGLECTYADGHAMGTFNTFVTLYVETQVYSNSLGKHIISEINDASALLLPEVTTDGVLKIRVFRDASHPNDTYPGEVHAWQSDIHYRRSRLGTINKAPNFLGDEISG